MPKGECGQWRDCRSAVPAVHHARPGRWAAGVSASAGQAEAPTSTSGPSPRNRCSYCCPPGNRLAKRKSIRPDELVNLPFISFPSHYAPALKRVTDDYLRTPASHFCLTSRIQFVTLEIALTPVHQTGVEMRL